MQAVDQTKRRNTKKLAILFMVVGLLYYTFDAPSLDNSSYTESILISLSNDSESNFTSEDKNHALSFNVTIDLGEEVNTLIQAIISR